MSETVTFNNTTLTLNKILHITPTGNDTTGDGTFSKPFLTLSKAVSSAASGDGIYIHAGTYRWMTFNGSYSMAVFDSGKALTIWGDRNQTIINAYGADVSTATSRDANLFVLSNPASKVIDITFNYYPNRGVSYSDAIFNACVTGASFYNLVINIPSGTAGTPTYSYNNSGGVPVIYNSVINSAVAIAASYSSQVSFVNCLLSSSQTSGCTKTNCLVRSATDNDLKLPVASDCLFAGSSSILNPDGSRSNIGILGGPYAWFIYTILYLAKTSDGHYHSHKSGSWVDLGIPSDQGAILLLFQDYGDKSFPRQDLIDQLGAGVKRCAWIDAATAPFSKLMITAVPFDQFIYPTGDIDLRLCSNIDWFHVNDGTTGYEAGGGKVRHLASRDHGVTYYAYDGVSAWNKILDTTNPVDGAVIDGRFLPSAAAMSRIISQGMTKAQFDAAPWQSWLIDAGYTIVRFGYALSMAASADKAFCDNLKYQYDGQGDWKVAVNGVDYDARFTNLSITLKWLTGGWRAKVNY